MITKSLSLLCYHYYCHHQHYIMFIIFIMFIHLSYFRTHFWWYLSSSILPICWRVKWVNVWNCCHDGRFFTFHIMGEYSFEDEIIIWEDLHHAHWWKLPFIKNSVSLYRFIIHFIHIYAFLNRFTFVCDVYISCNIFLSVTEQGLSQWKEMLHTRCYWVLVQSNPRMCRLARFLYDAQFIYISYIWSVSHMHHHSHSLKMFHCYGIVSAWSVVVCASILQL